MDRIKLLEQREKNANRVIGLQKARGALLRTQSQLELPFLQSHGVAQKEFDSLTADISRVQIEKNIANWLLDKAQLSSDRIPVKFWELYRRSVLLKRANELFKTSAMVLGKRGPLKSAEKAVLSHS